MSTRIDWRALLAERRIPFIERGPNVKRGELNIRCPLCGSSDPSFHMGIDPESGWWSCWRNRSEHSGKSPVRLLMSLLRISFAEALIVAGLDASYVDPDGFSAMAHKLRSSLSKANSVQESQLSSPTLAMHADFHPLRQQGATRRHWQYLWDRWFGPERLADEYGIEAGCFDEWKDRVILPYYEEGKLVTWSGRAIGTAEIRYRDLPLTRRRQDEHVAIVPAKETLFNHDAMLTGGDWLILVEGPMDALKLDCYGKAQGVRSIALSTASISGGQLARLDAYVAGFRHVGVMMDNKTQFGLVDSMRMRSQLASIGCQAKSIEVPFGRADAGELRPLEVEQFSRDPAATYPSKRRYA